MFRTVVDFAEIWKSNSACTQRYLDALTDDAIARMVAPGHRTLGAIAWHVAQTIPEMMGKTGLDPDGPAEDAPVPGTVAEIAMVYRTASASLLSQVTERWKDETLLVEDSLYGSQWKRGVTLRCLVEHETHHRGQMSVLMRQAGLRVPGTMGPAKEDWAKMGMDPPRI